MILCSPSRVSSRWTVSVSRSTVLQLTTLHSRSFSRSNPLDHRVVPERNIFQPHSKRPLNEREKEEKSIEEQLTPLTGHKLKDRMKGIKVQSKYFKEQVLRQDREIATEEAIKDLPPLTEEEIEDFYLNLLASGNELGNIPHLASPTHPAPASSFPPAQDKQAGSEQIDQGRQNLLKSISSGGEGTIPSLKDLETWEPDREVRKVSEASDLFGEEDEEPELVMVGARPDQTPKLKSMEIKRENKVERTKEDSDWSAKSLFELNSLFENQADISKNWEGNATKSEQNSEEITSNTERTDEPDLQDTSSALSTSSSITDTTSSAAVADTPMHTLPNSFQKQFRSLQNLPPLPSPPQSEILNKLEKLVLDLPSNVFPRPSLVGLDKETQPSKRQGRRKNDVPLGLITTNEWRKMITDAVHEADNYISRLPVEVQTQLKPLRQLRNKMTVDAKRVRQFTPLEKVVNALEGKALEQSIKALTLMSKSGESVWKEGFEMVLDGFAKRGDLAGVQSTLHAMQTCGAKITASAHSHLIIARLSNADLPGAITTLHSLEDQSIFVPEKTYISLIEPLLHSEIPAHRATGFNLFAHMRLVAYATPQREAFISLIKACGSSTDPQPERALDLWKEMTEEHGYLPEVNAFNAALCALVPVGRFWGEALRMFKTMLDFYKYSVPAGVIPGQSAQEQGESEQRKMYTPNRETFELLLQGAAKNGDLARTRWVLTEMIRFSRSSHGGDAVAPRSRTLELALMAYAAAKPSLVRGMVKLNRKKKEGKKERTDRKKATGGEVSNIDLATGKDEDGKAAFKETFDMSTSPSGSLNSPPTSSIVSGLTAEATTATLTAASSSSSSSSTSSTSSNEKGVSDPPSPKKESQPAPSVASPYLPQTSQEILHEANVLLSHAYNDSHIYVINPDWRSPSNHPPPLRFVQMTPRLVNSYLSVVYHHASSLTHCVERFRNVWSEVKVRPNGWSYLHILQRLMTVNSSDRQRAAKEAFEIFKEWQAFERKVENMGEKEELSKGATFAKSLKESLGLNERNIEGVWVYMIRIMTRADELSLADSILRRFVELYPPSLIGSSSIPALPSKSLVRMIPRHTIRPDPLPPHLVWPDVRALHARYVVYQQGSKIAHLTYVILTYEFALRRYRAAKLNEGSEGQTRRKEAQLDAVLVAKQEKQWENRKNRKKKGRRGLRTLDDFEGLYHVPDKTVIDRKDWKVLRTRGQRAMETHLRGKKQY
ncbi:FOG: PPR repeat [Phaffia rhodozyma]|uniref:FOG: PPR repeat n=1 Tax=Phaffia rhodozyma TaxID=264483 RepID=A0A0F7SE90_PHARH|nr:FOG: PPR repeat [Phaffia rhodozyma]